MRGLAAALLVVLTTGCGYHVAGSANVLPAEVHTIAITPWRNISNQYKLSDYIAESVTRELITRTKYQVIADPAKADAVLSGSIANLYSGATVSDPVKGATAAQLVVQIQVKLTGKDGKPLSLIPIELARRVLEEVDNEK